MLREISREIWKACKCLILISFTQTVMHTMFQIYFIFVKITIWLQVCAVASRSHVSTVWIAVSHGSYRTRIACLVAMTAGDAMVEIFSQGVGNLVGF